MAIDLDNFEFDKIIERLQSLENCKKIACSNGNYDYSRYLHGMANGIIFAISVINGEDPEYLSAPEKFLEDIKTQSDLPEEI